MPYTANTAFEVKNTNAEHQSLQNITGKFGSFSGSTFTGADCSAGFLCVKHSLLPLEGYESLVDSGGKPRFLNGNAWYMVAATNGTSGKTYGDHTGIYACNTYDVKSVGDANARYNLGIDTLGLGIPADVRGTFTELIVGEQYKWGVGDFASTPTVGQYVTISGGKWSASSASEPVGGTGVFGIVRRAEAFNEGASYVGVGYIVEIFRSAEVAAED